MGWMVTIGDFWQTTLEWLAGWTASSMLTTLGWVAGLAVAFGILGRLMPCNPGMHWWKDLRAAGTDIIYWFVVPLFLRVCRILMLIGGMALLFDGKDPQCLPVKQLPLWQQCLAILLLQDIMLYGIHRLFHTRLAWKIHAIHHSPKVLDWTSSSRFHPLNNLLAFSLADVAMLLLGFAPEAVVMLAPFNIVYATMVHANLNWTFGPLRFVFASPVFHRWHHTLEEEGLNKNYASTFPFLDVMFGTFYMPAGKLPEQFGNGAPDFPEHFWGQLIHPFRKKRTQPAQLLPQSGLTVRALKWASRRPIAAALMVMSLLTVVSLVGGRVFYNARLAQRNEQRARALEQAIVPPPDATLTKHTDAMLGVAISGDGRRIVSASEDGTVKVCDAGTGQELLSLKGHGRPVRGLAFSADGQRIVTGSADRTVKVWNAATGQEQLSLTGHTGAVLGVAISGDGRRIVSASVDFTAKVWDAATGQEQLTLKGPPGAVLGVAVSGDGRRIVSASGMSAKVWDAQTGREERTLTGHTDLVYCVALSPDGQRVITGSLDEKVMVWDAATGRKLLTLSGHAGPVYSVAISPDGTAIVSGSADGTVKVWDAATGRPQRTLTGHLAAVTSVAVSSGGRRIVSGSRDGTMKVWDASKYQPVAPGPARLTS